MASIVRYTAQLLPAGKDGKLVADANGYYTTVIGGLNLLNSVGEYYPLKGAKELFDQSSIFIRRVKSGCLKAEMGHPKRLPGMTNEDFINRILRIEETNTCAHFAEVWLDEDYGKNHPELGNPQLVAIMAEVRPTTPQLKEAFETGAENVCFSIRALTRDGMVNGVNQRVLLNILTFDCVTEPGLTIATKWHSPALETLDDSYFSVAEMTKVVNNMICGGVTMESDRAMATAALQAVTAPPPAAPSYLTW